MSKIDENNFIKPNENVKPDDSDWKSAANFSKIALQERWKTDAGKAKLNRIKACKLDKKELKKIVGMFNDHYDLRGIDLSGTNLSNCDLRDIDFFSANLSEANLTASDLSNSFLSECNIKKTTFDWAKMDNVYLDNAEYDNETSFNGVDIHKINFTLATLLYEHTLSNQRIEDLKRRNRIFSIVLEYTSDFGRSINRFLLTCIIVVVLFSLVYKFIIPAPCPQSLFISAKSFLGVEVIDEKGIVSYISLFEATIGYFMLALLASILVRKIMGGQ